MTPDQRQAALIAAGHALRTWVRTQRAGWDAMAAPFAPLHASAGEAAVAIAAPFVMADADTITGAPPDIAGASSPHTVPIGPLAARVGRGLWALVRGAGGVGAAAAGHWRLAAGAAALAVAVYAGVSYGPAAFSIGRAQLAAASKHVNFFDSPQPLPAEEEPAKRAPARAVARRVGRLQVDSNPSGAHVMVDGQEKGITPLTIGDLAAGKHTIVLRSEEGSVERAIVVAADKTTQVNEAIFSGWVHVSSPIELEIADGTRAVRLDDSNQVLLPPGPHELTFENRAYRFVETRKVTVLPGDTALLNVQPPRSSLSITATTPAEVLVDGSLVGGTPLTNFPLDVGTREITVRNAAGMERRSTITVTVEPIAMMVDFSN